MALPISLKVITHEGVAIDEPAAAICAPGEPGYLGILRNHAPLVTTLVPGTLTWRSADGTTHARHIGAGLLEVQRNHVTILTEEIR